MKTLFVNLAMSVFLLPVVGHACVLSGEVPISRTVTHIEQFAESVGWNIIEVEKFPVRLSCVDCNHPTELIFETLTCPIGADVQRRKEQYIRRRAQRCHELTADREGRCIKTSQTGWRFLRGYQSVHELFDGPKVLEIELYNFETILRATIISTQDSPIERFASDWPFIMASETVAY